MKDQYTVVQKWTGVQENVNDNVAIQIGNFLQV